MISPDLFVKVGTYRKALRVVDGFTILVGPNNSGKTRLLRLLFETKAVVHSISTLRPALDPLINDQYAKNLVSSCLTNYEQQSRSSTGDITLDIQAGRILFQNITSGGDNIADVVRGALGLAFCEGANWYMISSNRRPVFTETIHNSRRPVSENAIFVTERLYDALNEIQEGDYKSVERFRATVSQVCEIDDILGGIENKENMICRVVLSSGEKQQNLDQMGHGIKQAILLLALDTFCDGAFILVDEPESNMHPRLLTRILDHLKDSKRNYYIFATHSNILLRQEYSASLYAVKWQGENIELSELKDRNHALDVLGYSSIDNVLADVLILVEGPTDVLAVRAILDRHFSGRKSKYYAILHMGGDAMRHFACRDLSGRFETIFVILDGEDNATAKSARSDFKKLNKDILQSDHIFQLSRYALENYWSETAMMSKFAKDIPPGTVFPVEGSLSSIKIPSKRMKSLNRELALATSWSELESTDFGLAITKIVNYLQLG
ncbi:MAG: AAA family ATPase [Armatimonadetes bacterium]|nr:AAA family ATPase [Armatimonadota bacterium]